MQKHLGNVSVFELFWWQVLCWVRGKMWGKALLLATQALGRWDCGKHETCRAAFLEHSCILRDYQGKLSTSNMLRRQTWIRSLGKKAFSQQKEESKWRRSWMKTNSDLVRFFCVVSCMNCMNDNFARRSLLRCLWWCNLHHVLAEHQTCNVERMTQLP